MAAAFCPAMTGFNAQVSLYEISWSPGFSRWEVVAHGEHVSVGTRFCASAARSHTETLPQQHGAANAPYGLLAGTAAAARCSECTLRLAAETAARCNKCTLRLRLAGTAAAARCSECTLRLAAETAARCNKCTLRPETAARCIECTLRPETAARCNKCTLRPETAARCNKCTLRPAAALGNRLKLRLPIIILC